MTIKNTKSTFGKLLAKYNLIRSKWFCTRCFLQYCVYGMKPTLQTGRSRTHSRKLFEKSEEFKKTLSNSQPFKKNNRGYQRLS